MTKKPQGSSNKGIIADVVNAQAIAIGENATAVQNIQSADSAQLNSAIQELKQAIERLQAPEKSKASFADSVKTLETEVAKPAPDRGRVEGILKSLSSSSKLLGEFVSNASVILAPVAKIAALFGLAIP